MKRPEQINFALLLLISFGVLSCTHLPDRDHVLDPYPTRAPAAIDYSYDAQDKSCGGYPRLPIETLPGTCVGLVAGKELGFKFPRKTLVDPQTGDLYLTDMGAWRPGFGKVYRIQRKQNGSVQIQTVFEGLSAPHDLEFGPDNQIYIGEMGTLFRFNPRDPRPRKEVILSGLPVNQDQSPHSHPLVNFAFGKSSRDQWDLYVNVGSATDACVRAAPSTCNEEGRFAVLRRYKYEGSSRWSSQFEIVAQGLRNSMGLESQPNGLLIQAENARDLKDEFEPFEEVNVINPFQSRPSHYGWPYCYNFRAKSTEWNNNRSILCENFAPPWSLLPPHSAPLDLMTYTGDLIPDLKGKMLSSLHGYKSTGSRIVAFDVDGEQRPTQSPQAEWTYRKWTEQQRPNRPRSEPVTANPRGGLGTHSPYVEVTHGWSAMPGIRPAGTPVGLAQDLDGSIFIIEDKNKTILRMTRGQNFEFDRNPQIIPQTNVPTLSADDLIARVRNNTRQSHRYNYLKNEFFQPKCMECHEGMGIQETIQDEWTLLRWLAKQRDWIVPGKPEQSMVYIRSAGLGGNKIMPPVPTPPGTPDQLGTLKKFIEGM